ncbi:MAG: glycosyltransferase [Candidatus Hermodarchaeota archaeon]
MNILVLQETDWLIKGPNTQHHIFERLSLNPSIKIEIIDYDIYKSMHADSLMIKKQVYHNINRSIRNSRVKIIRTAHIQIPYFRRLSSLITNLYEIFKIIRKNKPDVIISFSISNGLIGLLIAKMFKIPFIFYYIDILHELIPIKGIKKFGRIVSRFLLKYSDYTIVVTKLLYDYVLNEGANPKKVKIILNGISLANTKVNKEKYELLRKKFNIYENDFVILFMGYLYDFAGLKEIIEYYDNQVKNGLINLKFIIIGYGGIYSFLKNYIKEIHAKWVMLTGRLSFFELPEYIELADLCLLSFKLNDITRNITPVKLMEYMAMQKPVLSTELPSVINEIGENNGVIFAKNQNHLIEMIGELSINKQELKEIGIKGFNLIKQKYLWSKLINKFKKIMLYVIKKR